MVCPANHRFDLARDGYLPLLGRPYTGSERYDRELFIARRRVHQFGFFQPLQEAIEQELRPLTSACQLYRLLDAGCGEGSLLADLISRLVTRTEAPILGVGLDLAKDAILTAAKQDAASTLWCVGDLAAVPCASQSFDVILNILSPSNYPSFHRLLAPGGQVIKVMPGPHYLQELRQLLYGDHTVPMKGTASMARFRDAFPVCRQRRITGRMVLEGPLIHDMLRMTPLAWRAPAAALEAIHRLGQLEVTLDWVLVVGQSN